MKETRLLNSHDIDRVVEDSLNEEGEEMVADDVKKGSIPIRLVNQAKDSPGLDLVKSSQSCCGHWKEQGQPCCSR